VSARRRDLAVPVSVNDQGFSRLPLFAVDL
jgi:hypothetical protein